MDNNTEGVVTQFSVKRTKPDLPRQASPSFADVAGSTFRAAHQRGSEGKHCSSVERDIPFVTTSGNLGTLDDMER